MPMEHLLVKFRKNRFVMANGKDVGPVNEVLMLPRGEYEISLSGGGFVPEKQPIVLNGTSPDKPMTLIFHDLYRGSFSDKPQRNEHV